MNNKKIVILLVIIFTLITALTCFQVFNILLTDSIDGLPPELTMEEVIQKQIMFTLLTNIGLFILISLGTVFANNYFLKKTNEKLNNKAPI